MTALTDILADIQDTDATLGDLRARLAAKKSAVAEVNVDALAKRRKDLERKLDRALRHGQLDLVRLVIEDTEGLASPAGAIARSILTFQEMVTAVFDAIRDKPKDAYEPTADNRRLSTMSFGAARTDPFVIALSIPNDRLLVIDSDLDLAMPGVFGLLTMQNEGEVWSLIDRFGVAAATTAASFAANAVENRLNITVSWKRPAEEPPSVMVTSEDAKALQALLGGLSADRAETVEENCELISVDDSSETFRLATPGGHELFGHLAEDFQRGAAWTTHAWYRATLTRMRRIRIATGERAARWSLHRLRPL